MTYMGWYEVYDLGTKTFAIYEPGHFQEVISFLVLGDDKALLLDTGMGICKIKPLVDKLTDLPVIIVNSHSHFDHIGGNWEFDRVHIFNFEPSLNRLKSGMMKTELNHHLCSGSVWLPYPNDFNPDEYSIKPSIPAPITDGHVFDLGGRILEVIHTPGHSPDSIMLWDKKNSILFTGDTFYPATLYSHLSSDGGIDSVFKIYMDTMVYISENIKVDFLYTSHNYPIVRGNKLREVAAAFKSIAAGKMSYLTDEGDLKKYQFDGFAIVCK